jgi:hypothetical protein
MKRRARNASPTARTAKLCEQIRRDLDGLSQLHAWEHALVVSLTRQMESLDALVHGRASGRSRASDH